MTHPGNQPVGPGSATVVLEVSGVAWASTKSVAEAMLSRGSGVLSVLANPVAQIATVTFDPSRTSVAQLTQWVRDCGFHCAGQSVPDHVCDPQAEPTSPALRAASTDHEDHATHAGHEGHVAASSQEAMGHGGHHGGMSMATMVADMRRRFLVAAVASVPILLWSPIGREVIGFSAAAPFRLRDDVLSLLLSRRTGGHQNQRNN